MEIRTFHYKENSPEETINRIRRLLSALDIFVIEQEWHNSHDCYHSLTLVVEGTSFTVNGKGVTRSLALASAYGELMERMQNMTLFKLVHDFSKLDEGRHSFYYAPDEIILNEEELLNQQSIWLDTHTAKKAAKKLGN